MALTGVTRPGHIQLRVLDLEESVRFYTDVLGLVETGRDGQGRVYFKTAGKSATTTASSSVRPTEAGMDFIGFKVLNEATLDQAREGPAGLRRRDRAHPGRRPARDRRASALHPADGHEIELYATKKILGNPLGDFNPKPYSPGLDHGIAPVRFDHALLYGPNVERRAGPPSDVLGFHLTEYVTLPDRHQGRPLARLLEQGTRPRLRRAPRAGSSLHHVAFLMESWERVLRAADIMSANDVPVDIGPTRHGITRGGTIYAWDPSGNRFETFQGGLAPYPDWGPIRWDWSGLGEGGGLDVEITRRFEDFVAAEMADTGQPSHVMRHVFIPRGAANFKVFRRRGDQECARAPPSELPSRCPRRTAGAPSTTPSAGPRAWSA
jgi:catechol 2,3-dioxygenase